MGLHIEGNVSHSAVICQVAIDSHKVGELQLTLAEWDRLRGISARFDQQGWFSVKPVEDK